MESKLTNNCFYSAHVCKRLRYRDNKYCFQHILEDKSTPLTKCQHISKVTKMRCINPALKPDRNSLTSMAMCDHHRHIKAQNNKHKNKLRRNLLSNETTNYAAKQKAAIHQLESNFLPKTEQQNESDSSDEDQAQLNEKWQVHNSSSWKSGERDIDLQLLDENDNALLYTDIFTPEEIVRLSRDNLVHLQAMYIDQFKHLHHELIMNRLQYLSSNPTESGCSKEELQCLLNFRQCSGPEALLLKQKKEKRLAESNMDQTLGRIDHHLAKPRCCHVSNHVRCKSSCLPYTKFCVLHILHDPLQVLYKPCSHMGCEEPVCLINCKVISPNVSDRKSYLCPIHVNMLDTQDDFHTLTSKLAKPSDLQDNCPIVLEKAADTSALKEVSMSLDVDVGKSEPNSCEKNVYVSDHSMLEHDSAVHLITDKQNKEDKLLLESNIPVHMETLFSVSSPDFSNIAKTTTCALDDLQPSQCYLLNSSIKKNEQSLHLQKLTGINSTGNPELGQCLVVRTTCGQPTTLGKFQSNDSHQSVQLNLDTQDKPGEKPVIAEVTHKGSLLSISHQVAPYDIVYDSKHTFIPPIEKKICLEDNQLLGMPPLAPMCGSSVSANDSQKGSNLLKNKIKTTFSNGDLDRKPTCPDEETAIASLLSLCTPTSLPKLDTMPN